MYALEGKNLHFCDIELVEKVLHRKKQTSAKMVFEKKIVGK